MTDAAGKIERIARHEATRKTKAQLADELWHATYALQEIQETLRGERTRRDEDVAGGREELRADAVAYDMLSFCIGIHLKLYTQRADA